jgi:hypothetical protein
MAWIEEGRWQYSHPLLSPQQRRQVVARQQGRVLRPFQEGRKQGTGNRGQAIYEFAARRDTVTPPDCIAPMEQEMREAR